MCSESCSTDGRNFILILHVFVVLVVLLLENYKLQRSYNSTTAPPSFKVTTDYRLLITSLLIERRIPRVRRGYRRHSGFVSVKLKLLNCN